MTEITENVITQLAGVRETGATNMMDKSGVQSVADQCDFHELVVFIEDASNVQYMEALQEMGSRR